MATLKKSRSLTGLAFSSANSFETPWSTPVLGDSYRSSWTTKNPFVQTIKKTASFPKAPRPTRTRQIFLAVKDGIWDCIRSAEEDILRMTKTENHVGYLPAAQHIKLAERLKKRLQLHLTKIEQLEESYTLNLQLWEGAKTMAKAYMVYSGKKSSPQKVDCGVKECVQTLCSIEASLESLLGTFECSLKGLFGFARLVPGDVFEVIFRYGHQKWKSRGKIGVTNQSWDPMTKKLKAIIGESFSVRATEVKMLGKQVGLEETSCDSLQLFASKPQDLMISLNPSSSLKLGLLVKWNPLEGADDSTSLCKVSNRVRSAPGRREVPVRSMIDGDGQLESWSRGCVDHTTSGVVSRRTKPPESSSVAKNNRHSVPCFPSNFDSFLHGANLAEHSKSCDRNPRPTSSSETPDSVVLRQKRRSFQQTSLSGFSDSSIRKVQRYSSGVLDRIVEFNLKQEDQEDVKTKWRKTQKSMLGSFGESIVESLESLKSKIEQSGGRLDELNDLRKEVGSIECLLQKANVKPGDEGSSSSEANVSIESALQAFNFLDSEDFVEEADIESKDKFGGLNYELLDKQSPESTARTTDSGIESIANHLDDDVDDGVGSLTKSDMPSTGSWQVDVALNWHLQYCISLLNNLGKAGVLENEQNISVEKLKRQSVVLSKLIKIARKTDQEPDIHQVLNELTSEDELKQFWLHCIQSHLLLTTTEEFMKQLTELENQLPGNCKGSQKKIFSIVISHILDAEESQGADFFESDIVTLHQFMEFFDRIQMPNVWSYVKFIAEQVRS